ncbi:hypothetical protein ACTWP5_28505 [Streptomyces sp. 4N509B]|uniref:hypothetical protein n=1 Tax=Streptomyces sp. 4N509B TaxID=3457413 RepID=UPI003FCFCFE3
MAGILRDDATVARLLAEGGEAMVRGDARAGHRAFDEAARLAARHPHLVSQWVQALQNRASASHQLGDHTAAADGYRRALAICESLPGDPLLWLRAPLLTGLASVLVHVSDLPGATAAARQARELALGPLVPLVDEPSRVSVLFGALTSLTQAAMQGEELVRAQELATEALDVATRHGMTDQQCYPLMNLADIHHTLGHTELAEDFARQGLAAAEASGRPNGIAQLGHCLGQILLRQERLEEAEPLLLGAQEHFEEAGLAHKAAQGWQYLGLLAGLREDLTTAVERFERSARLFEECGAATFAAGTWVRWATAAFALGWREAGEERLTHAADIYAAHPGMGAWRAHLHSTHAQLLANHLAELVEADPEGRLGPEAQAVLARAVDLAVPAALAIDAVRFTLPNGAQRDRWRRQIAEPAMALAFRLATVAGDAALVCQLVESQCAGTPLQESGVPALGASTDGGIVPPDELSGFDLPTAQAETPAETQVEAPPDAPPPSGTGPGAGALGTGLGGALASVAASAGLPVAPPPRLAFTPEGREIVLAEAVARAEERYGIRVRQERVVPSW